MSVVPACWDVRAYLVHTVILCNTYSDPSEDDRLPDGAGFYVVVQKTTEC